MLNNEYVAFQIDANYEINHLLYMEDLKKFAKDETHSEQQLVIVKTFSDDIKMEFSLDKCASAIYKHGKLVKSHNV